MLHHKIFYKRGESKASLTLLSPKTDEIARSLENISFYTSTLATSRMNEINAGSVGEVTIRSTLNTTDHQILNDFDDENKIVIIEDALRQPIDFVSFLKDGQETYIKVQSYTRSVQNEKVVVIEDETAPLSMTCKKYYEYIKKCNIHFDGLLMERQKQAVPFQIVDNKGDQITIDLREVVLYAIDIPLKLLSFELDRIFRKSFLMSELCLPGQKYCYYQFVSKLNNYVYFREISVY